MKWNSLKFKIPSIILAIGLGSILMITMFVQNITSEHIKEDVLKNNVTVSNMLSQHTYSYIKNAKETIITAANFATESRGDIDEINEEIFRVYDNFKYFDLIYFLDTEGNMILSKPENKKAMVEYNYSDRLYFQEVMSDKLPYISDLYIGRALGQFHFVIAAPVFDENKDVVGLIGGGIKLSNIKKIVDEVQENFDGEIYIVDQTGTLLIDSKTEEIKGLKKINNRVIFKNGKINNLYNILKGKDEGILTYKKYDNDYYSATSFIEEVNWTIFVEQSEDAILKEMIWLKKQLKSIAFIITFTTIIIGLISAHEITGPIERLVKEVKTLGISYKKVNHIDINSNDEIGELARVFNDMSVKLKENVDELKKSYTRENYFRQYLDNILKSLGRGIIVVNKEGNITIFNNAAEEITGFKSQEYIGRDAQELFNKTELLFEKITKKIYNKEENVLNLERNLIRKDKKHVPVNISISPVLNEEKNMIGMIYLFNDISSKKKMEQELKRIDKMHILGELSASLIHDIGNPLSGISNLLELLNYNWEDEKLREEIFKLLNDEIMDLNDITVNFLSFSKDTSINREANNIVEIVEEVISLLKPEMINKNIKLSKNYFLKEKCVVNINRANIKQAFINIIINCIQAVDEGGKIIIIVRNDKDKVRISIKDNGKGIQKKDLKKIFEPFYTTKKEGTGLGLSSTYKIIKEHEGHIFINSKINEGTEFVIDLDK